jgi:hypothetical protein
MKTQQFGFVLERLKPGDWGQFEQLPSQFLIFDDGQDSMTEIIGAA